MASIFNQDIGLNYKGIITLGSTINQNLSGTLQYLTDGDGNNLPLQVSTTGLQFNAIETIYRNAAGTNIAMNVWGNLGRVAIGGLATNYTPSASLQVRGDGTNPIFRVENSSGTTLVTISNTGTIDSSVGAINLTPTSSGIYFATNGIIQTTISSGLFIRYGAHTTMPNGITLTSNSDLAITATSGTSRAVGIISSFAAAAGSALYRPLSINYTINNTGPQTGNTTGIFLNATQINLNNMTHNLMDLQNGGISRLSVDATGQVTSANGFMDGSGFTSRFYQNNLQLYSGNIMSGFIGGAGFTMNTKLYIGATAVTPVARLTVRGDSTNPIARFETSAGVEQVTISNTGAFSVVGTISSGNGLSVGGAGYFLVGADGGASTAKLIIRQSSNYLGLYGSNAVNAVFRFDSAANMTNTTGADLVFLGVRNTFNPTSGTASYSNFSIEPIVNQTGGANGITRGLYVAPTLTAAADFRAVEVKAGSTAAHKLMLLTNAAGNKVIEVNAAQEIGFFNTAPTGQQDVSGSRANPEEALANLLLALASYGIIIDNTTV
jgi:hypothetical protein